MGSTIIRVWSSSEILETGVLIIKLWDASDSLSSYYFRFLLLREYSYSHWDIIISWFIPYLTHWAVELTLPQTGILQVAWRQRSELCCAGFILNQSQLCTLEYLCLLMMFVDTWDRWIILYLYIYLENRCSSFISSWHLRYLLLGCGNKKCIINIMTMRSWNLSFLKFYGCREGNSRAYVVMFLHK